MKKILIFLILLESLIFLPFAHGQGRVSTRDLQNLINRYGKENIVEAILGLRGGQITIVVRGNYEKFLGVPNSNFVTAETVGRDLQKAGVDAKSLETILQRTATLQAPTQKKTRSTRISTADWKTFRGKKFGCQFKYSPEWQVYEDENLVMVPIDEHSGFALGIFLKFPVDEKSIDQVDKTEFKKHLGEFRDLKMQKVNWKGRKAMSIEGPIRKENREAFLTSIWTIQKGHLYALQFFSAPPEEISNYQPLFHAVLSSFQIK